MMLIVVVAVVVSLFVGWFFKDRFSCRPLFKKKEKEPKG